MKNDCELLSCGWAEQSKAGAGEITAVADYLFRSKAQLCTKKRKPIMVVVKPFKGRHIKGTRESGRAGLAFSVSRLRTALRRGNYARCVGRTAPVQLGGALESLTRAAWRRILAGVPENIQGRNKIRPRDIKLEELQDLLGTPLTR